MSSLRRRSARSAARRFGTGVLQALLAITLAQIGCGDGSSGDYGEAEFAWDEGLLTCLAQCDLREPMATNSRAEIRVLNDDELPRFDVESSDPAIAEFVKRNPDIRVDSFMEGETDLILTDARDGRTIDRITVRVRDVTSIELEDPDLFLFEYLLLVGSEEEVHLDLLAGTSKLQGEGSVTYSLTDGLTPAEVRATPSIDDRGFSLSGPEEYVLLEGRRVGSGTVVATADSGVEFSFPMAVISANDVTDVTLSGWTVASVGETLILRAEAERNGEPVYGPRCVWDVQNGGGPVRVRSQIDDQINLTSDAPGSATVRCTIGLASDVRTVTFTAP